MVCVAATMASVPLRTRRSRGSSSSLAIAVQSWAPLFCPPCLCILSHSPHSRLRRAIATHASLSAACAGVAYLLLKCSQATLTLIPAGTRRQRTERRRSTHTGTVNLGSGHWASCGRLLGLGLDTTEAGRAELPPGLRALQAAFTAAHKVTRVLKGLGGAGGGANCGEHVPSSPLDASRHGREAACGAAAGGCGQLHSESSHLEA